MTDEIEGSPSQHKPFRVRRDAAASDILASFDTPEDAVKMCGADVAVGVMLFMTVGRSCGPRAKVE
jgi:hypothetical protein